MRPFPLFILHPSAFILPPSFSKDVAVVAPDCRVRARQGKSRLVVLPHSERGGAKRLVIVASQAALSAERAAFKLSAVRIVVARSTRRRRIPEDPHGRRFSRRHPEGTRRLGPPPVAGVALDCLVGAGQRKSRLVVLPCRESGRLKGIPRVADQTAAPPERTAFKLAP